MRTRVFSIIIILFLMLSSYIFIPHQSNELLQVEAASTWTQTSDTDFIHGIFKNVVINGSGSNAKLRLAQTKGWFKIECEKHPSSRSSHGIAPIFGTNDILLFSGYNSGYYFDDTWLYNSTTEQWKKILISFPPGHRSDHGMATIWGTDNILMFGGNRGLGAYGDTWVYIHEQKDWRQRSPWSPGSRYSTALSTIFGTDKVLLFGGNRAGYMSDTWIYDNYYENWTNQYPYTQPGPRKFHSMAPIPNTDKVLLFGGETGGSYPVYVYSDETWIYDLSVNNWTNVTSSIKPSPRCSHKLTTLWNSNKILLFGGNNNGKYYDDTWVFYCSNYTWKKVTNIETPGPRAGHGLASIIGTDEILLFGGYNGTNYFNDSWSFDPCYPLDNGTYISSAYDTGFNSTFQSLSWTGELPEDTSIKLQLKTGSTEKELTKKEFLGPDGTAETYYDPISIQIWPNIWYGHSGDRWIQYKVYFYTTNKYELPGLNDVTITYNCWPTTEAFSPKNGYNLNNNKPTFSWAYNDLDGDDQTSFQVLIDNDIDFNNIDYDSGKQISNFHQWHFPDNTAYSELPEGTWYWKVRTKDRGGDLGPFSAPFKFIVDTIKPASKIITPSNNTSLSYLNTISGTACDLEAGTGLARVELSIKRLSDNHYWDGKNFTNAESWVMVYGTEIWEYNSISVPWQSDTKYNIKSRAIDKASNFEMSKFGNTIAFDLDKPDSTILLPENNSYVNKLDLISGVALDFGGADIKNVNISIQRESDKQYWGGVRWAPGMSWLMTDGTNNWTYNGTNIKLVYGQQYIIRSRAYDTVGNREFPGAKNYFIFDDRPPKDSIIIINDGAQFSNSTKVILSLSSTDDLAGVEHMAFSTDNHNWTRWQKLLPLTTYNLTPGDGEKTVYFKARDSALNNAETVFSSIYLDSTPPQNLSIVIDNGAIKTNSTKVNLVLSAEDEASGVDQMSFKINNGTWSSWESFKNKLSYRLTSEDGDKNIYFRVKDKIGNIAEPVFATINLNTTLTTDSSNNDKKSAENIFASHGISIIIIVIIIIVILITLFTLLKHKKKRKEKQPIMQQTVTIKPNDKPKPEVTVKSVTLTPKNAQLSMTTVKVSPQYKLPPTQQKVQTPLQSQVRSPVQQQTELRKPGD